MKSRFSITYSSGIQSFWNFAICETSNRFDNWNGSYGCTRFQLKISFGRIFYIAQHPWSQTVYGLLNKFMLLVHKEQPKMLHMLRQMICWSCCNKQICERVESLQFKLQQIYFGRSQLWAHKLVMKEVKGFIALSYNYPPINGHTTSNRHSLSPIFVPILNNHLIMIYLDIIHNTFDGSVRKRASLLLPARRYVTFY